MKKPIVLLFTLFLFINTASALSTGTISAYPTEPNAETPSSFLLEATPGSSLSDSISIKNLSNQNQTILVYAVDTFINSQNSKVFKSHDQERENLGIWTTFNGEKELELALEPDETKVLPFDIKIPSDAEYKSYQAGIMVEHATTANNDNEPESFVSIKTKVRLGVGMNLKVTDNPRTIEKLPPVENTPASNTMNLVQIYFIASLALAIIVVSVMVFQEKQKKSAKKVRSDK